MPSALFFFCPWHFVKKTFTIKLMRKNPADILGTIRLLLEENRLSEIKKNIPRIFHALATLPADSDGHVSIFSNSSMFQIDKNAVLDDLRQIQDTRTIERTKYYLRRLVKSISEMKPGTVNDLNLNRWKEYKDLITDSLWVLEKRERSGAHSAGYWGNFIPQIPNQLFRRYTKKGDWVLDPFLGSGTSLIECKRLGRNGIGVELRPEIAKTATRFIQKETDLFSSRSEIIIGDSTKLDFISEANCLGVKSIQFLIMHPPYWDIIKFSNDARDLSNAPTVSEFLDLFGKVVDNTYPLLDTGRYFAVVIGDKYSEGQWLPLGFLTMQEVLRRNVHLKSIIVKNFDETRAKRNQKELWRYRALAGGFYVFKHEYILLFQKPAK
jgi:hypothetical protein